MLITPTISIHIIKASFRALLLQEPLKTVAFRNKRFQPELEYLLLFNRLLAFFAVA